MVTTPPLIYQCAFPPIFTFHDSELVAIRSWPRVPPFLPELPSSAPHHPPRPGLASSNPSTWLIFAASSLAPAIRPSASLECSGLPAALSNWTISCMACTALLSSCTVQRPMFPPPCWPSKPRRSTSRTHSSQAIRIHRTTTFRRLPVKGASCASSMRSSTRVTMACATPRLLTNSKTGQVGSAWISSFWLWLIAYSHRIVRTVSIGKTWLFMLVL